MLLAPSLDGYDRARAVCSGLLAQCHIKMSPREKSALGEKIAELICLTLLKYCQPHKKSSHYRIAPLTKVFLG